MASFNDERHMHKVDAISSIGRPATTEEIAGLPVFLSLDVSSYMARRTMGKLN